MHQPGRGRKARSLESRPVAGRNGAGGVQTEALDVGAKARRPLGLLQTFKSHNFLLTCPRIAFKLEVKELDG